MIEMSVVKIVISSINIINEKLGVIVSFLFLPITFIAVYEVVVRYIFNNPTVWAWDMNMQLFAPLVMLSGGYVLLHDGHVAVDILVIELSPRKRAILDLFTLLILFLAMIVLIWKGTLIGFNSFVRGERTSSIWGPPLWTIKMWVPIGAFFVLLQGISKFLCNLQIIFSQSELRERSSK